MPPMTPIIIRNRHAIVSDRGGSGRGLRLRGNASVSVGGRSVGPAP